MLGERRSIARIPRCRHRQRHLIEVNGNHTSILCALVWSDKLWSEVHTPAGLQKLHNGSTRLHNARHQSAFHSHICEHTQLVDIPVHKGWPAELHHTGVRGRSTPVFLAKIGIADQVENKSSREPLGLAGTPRTTFGTVTDQTCAQRKSQAVEPTQANALRTPAVGVCNRSDNDVSRLALLHHDAMAYPGA